LLTIAHSLTCLFAGVRGVPEALLTRKLRFKALSVRSIIAKVLGAAVTIVLAFQGAGAWAIILGSIAYSAASTCLVLLSLRRRPKYRFAIYETVDVLRFGMFSLADAL